MTLRNRYIRRLVIAVIAAALLIGIAAVGAVSANATESRVDINIQNQTTPQARRDIPLLLSSRDINDGANWTEVFNTLESGKSATIKAEGTQGWLGWWDVYPKGQIVYKVGNGGSNFKVRFQHTGSKDSNATCESDSTMFQVTRCNVSFQNVWEGLMIKSVLKVDAAIDGPH